MSLHLSVCSRGERVGQTLRLPRQTLKQNPPGQTSYGTDIQWRPLQRSVRILLECILVKQINHDGIQSHFSDSMLRGHSEEDRCE